MLLLLPCDGVGTRVPSSLRAVILPPDATSRLTAEGSGVGASSISSSRSPTTASRALRSPGSSSSVICFSSAHSSASSRSSSSSGAGRLGCGGSVAAAFRRLDLRSTTFSRASDDAGSGVAGASPVGCDLDLVLREGRELEAAGGGGGGGVAPPICGGRREGRRAEPDGEAGPNGKVPPAMAASALERLSRLPLDGRGRSERLMRGRR